jgi:hypothetical protein
MYASIKPKSIGTINADGVYTEPNETSNKREDDNIVEIGIVPIDGDDYPTYSNEEGVSPYSFLDENTPYNKKSPPP